MDIFQSITKNVFPSTQNAPALTPAWMVAVWLVVGWVGWIVLFRFTSFSKSIGNIKSSNGSVPMVAGGYPFVGHALEFGSNTEHFLQRCKDEYGSIFGCTIMGRTYVFIDGSYKDTYFASNANELSFFDAVKVTVVPQFTVGMDSMLHQWHVPLIRRQMSPSNVTRFYATLQEQALRVLEQELGSLHIGDSFVHRDVQGLACRIIASCSSVSFLGPQLGQNKEILHVFLHLHTACFHLMNLAAVLPHSILWMFSRNVKGYQKTLRRWVIPEVVKRRASPNTTTDDLLSVMVQLTDKGQLFTPEQIADRCMTLIFASMITTAGALRHAIYDLAGYWDRYSDALIEEQAQVIGAHGPALTPEALSAMPMLNAFMNESMRMSALPIQTTRMFMKDSPPDTSLMESNHKIRLPKGAMVCLSGYLATHDPNVFPEPREFRIERFLQEEAIDPAILGLFPFGIGKHMCPGRFFALAEVQATLCTLLRQYTVRTVSGQVPKYLRIPIDTTRVQEPVEFIKVEPKGFARVVL